MSMRPFLASVRLSSPVILDAQFAVTLDALLAARLFELGEIQSIEELPILDSGGLLHASCGQLQELVDLDVEVSFTRGVSLCMLRDEPFRLTTKSTKIEKNRAYRPSLDSYRCVSAGSIRWYGVGDVTGVRSALDRVIGIGKKIRQGFGAVVPGSCEVLEVDDDRSIFRRSARAGQFDACRPVPLDRWNALGLGPPRRSGFTTWRPPYWSPASRTLCALPYYRY